MEYITIEFYRLSKWWLFYFTVVEHFAN